MTTESLLRDIKDRLERIERDMEKLKKQGQKRGLSFGAAIPPISLCKDIVNGGDLGTWEHQMQILSDYYGVHPMGNYSDSQKVPKGAIACYHPLEGNAYYSEPSSELETILHEFFHHLVSQGVIDLGRKNEEVWANKYAETIIRRGTV